MSRIEIPTSSGYLVEIEGGFHAPHPLAPRSHFEKTTCSSRCRHLPNGFILCVDGEEDGDWSEEEADPRQVSVERSTEVTAPVAAEGNGTGRNGVKTTRCVL